MDNNSDNSSPVPQKKPKKSIERIYYHPLFPRMAELYNDYVIRDGMLRNQFYKTYVTDLLPGWGVASFFAMTSKYALTTPFRLVYDKDGKVESLVRPDPPPAPPPPQSEGPVAQVPAVAPEVPGAVASSEAASYTARGIEAALRLGAHALEDLMSDPEKLSAMSAKDRADLLFKAMRAQDQRVNTAINARKEVRAGKAFQKSFDEAAYQIDELAARDSLPAAAS